MSSAPSPATPSGPSASGPPSGHAALDEIDLLDHAVAAAVTATPTPVLDASLSRLSDAANRSQLWALIAAALAVTGGRRGRRAAVRGLSAIAVASFTANITMKFTFRRRRPAQADAVAGRRVAVPRSTSFPSGHASSAFAFAAAVSDDMPELALPLYGLALAVGYSRVHTGVHHPSDVLAGELLGLTVGSALPRFDPTLAASRAHQ